MESKNMYQLLETSRIDSSREAHFFAKWYKGKGKEIPLEALTGPEGSRRLKLPNFKTIGTWMWQGCQPYAPTAFTPSKYSWYSFLLEAESAPGPQCDRKDYVNEKIMWDDRESNPRPSCL
jgi:hypothetical protein